jgi:hypothetical protein
MPSFTVYCIRREEGEVCVFRHEKTMRRRSQSANFFSKNLDVLNSTYPFFR